MKIHYGQAYTFLSKQKKAPQKANDAAKSVTPATTTGKAKTVKTAKEIHTAIKQMEQDLAALRKRLDAQVKVEEAALKKFKKAARV